MRVRGHLLLTMGLVGIGLCTGVATAQVPAGPTDRSTPLQQDGAQWEWFGETGSKPWWEWERATGDWGGMRTSLEDAGISIGAEYVAEYSAVLDGGLRQRGSFRNAFALDAEIDTDVLIGLPGGTFFVQFLTVNFDNGGSFDAGDIQAFSNIQTPYSLTGIFEMWYEQLLFDDRVRIKVGKVDANSEFNFVDAAGDFANSSAGFSPTIFVFPSYPDSAMSVNLFVTLVDTESAAFTLGYGFYDGAAGVDGVRTGSRGPSTFFSDDLSDDYFHVIQGELTWDQLGGLPDGRLSAGGWWHTGEFGRFDGGTDDGTGGFFLTVEQRLYAWDGIDNDTGLSVFAQYGWADEQVSEFSQHIAGGFVARGLIPSRESDAAGIYVTHVDLSDEPGAGFADDETAIDLYYRIQVTPAVYVQPELQYIINPSGDPTVDDALVGGIRVGITF
jgi:porin